MSLEAIANAKDRSSGTRPFSPLPHRMASEKQWLTFIRFSNKDACMRRLFLASLLILAFATMGTAQEVGRPQIILRPQNLILSTGTASTSTGLLPPGIEHMNIVMLSGTMYLLPILSGTTPQTTGTISLIAGGTLASHTVNVVPNSLPALPYSLAISTTAAVIMYRNPAP